MRHQTIRCFALMAYVGLGLAVLGQEGPAPTPEFYTNATVQIAFFWSGNSCTGMAQTAGEVLPLVARRSDMGAITGSYDRHGTRVDFSGKTTGQALAMETSEGLQFTVERSTTDWTRPVIVPFVDPVVKTDASDTHAFTDTAWGLSIHPPPGWRLQAFVRDIEREYLLTSPDGAQVVWLIRLPHSTGEEIEKGFRSGITRREFAFRFKDMLPRNGKSDVRATFLGQVGKQPVGATVLGRMIGNVAVGVAALSRAGEEPGRALAVLAAVAGGLQPMERRDAETDRVTRRLNDSRLIFVPSVNDPPAGAPFSEFYRHTWIDLGSKGYFTYRDKRVDNMTDWVMPGARHKLRQVDPRGVWAPLSHAKGCGTWQIVSSSGSHRLELRFYDGRRHLYQVDFEVGLLRLNGKPFSSTGPDAPVKSLRPVCP
jgi:hypothetical protein